LSTINVTKQDNDTFKVEVVEETTTEHIVTVTDEDHQKINPDLSKEELLKKSFEFCLKRESKENILSEFNITVIGKYFPEYWEEIKS